MSKSGTRNELLTPPEAAAYLRVTKGHLANRRSRGDGPPYIKIGRNVRYRVEDLDAWLNERTFESTSSATVADSHR